MKTPKKVGEPVDISPRIFGKAMVNQKFVNPQGEEYDYALWDYKHGEPPVIFMAFTEKGEVIALRQFRHAANEVIYEVPGGCLMKGKTAEETVRQELLEETGYKAGDIQHLTPVKKVWFEPTNLTVPYDVYLVTECERVSNPNLDETEYIEVSVIPWNIWVGMIRDGEVVDSKSIVVTFLTMLHYCPKLAQEIF